MRQELLDVIDGRLPCRPLFAPLADAMYAASVAGKEWLSEARFGDRIEAAHVGGYPPLFLQYLPLHDQLHPALELICAEGTLPDFRERIRKSGNVPGILLSSVFAGLLPLAL
jgi:hypothetical protein